MLYLRMCLAYSAGTTPLSKNLVDMQDDAPAIGRYIHTLLTSDPQPLGSKGAESNPVHVYMDLLQQLLSAIGGKDTSGLRFSLHYFHEFVFFLHFDVIICYPSTGIPVMYCLLEVVSVCPEKLAPIFVEKIDWIKVS